MDKTIEEQVDQIAFLVKRFEETTDRALKILKCIEERVELEQEEEPNNLV